MNSYHKGQQIRITGTFTVNGTATDPTTVTLKVQDPTGAETTYTYALSQITKSTTGIYYKDLTLNISGYWHYRWEVTGAVVASDEDKVFTKFSVF